MTRLLLIFLISINVFSQTPTDNAKLRTNSSKNPLVVLWIDFSGKNLKVLPDSILKFKNLRAIYLSKNPNLNLHQTFEILKKLEHFENVDLQDCYVTSLPDNIYELKRLNSINLSKNPIRTIPKKFIEFKNLAQLELSDLLYIDWKSTFNILSKIPSLKVVTMKRMNLKTMPSNFKKLQQVDLFYLNESLFETKEQVRVKNSVPNAKVIFNGT